MGAVWKQWKLESNMNAMKMESIGEQTELTLMLKMSELQYFKSLSRLEEALSKIDGKRPFMSRLPFFRRRWHAWRAGMAMQAEQYKTMLESLRVDSAGSLGSDAMRRFREFSHRVATAVDLCPVSLRVANSEASGPDADPYVYIPITSARIGEIGFIEGEALLLDLDDGGCIALYPAFMIHFKGSEPTDDLEAFLWSDIVPVYRTHNEDAPVELPVGEGGQDDSDENASRLEPWTGPKGTGAIGLIPKEYYFVYESPKLAQWVYLALYGYMVHGYRLQLPRELVRDININYAQPLQLFQMLTDTPMPPKMMQSICGCSDWEFEDMHLYVRMFGLEIYHAPYGNDCSASFPIGMLRRLYEAGLGRAEAPEERAAAEQLIKRISPEYYTGLLVYVEKLLHIMQRRIKGEYLVREQHFILLGDMFNLFEGMGVDVSQLSLFTVPLLQLWFRMMEPFKALPFEAFCVKLRARPGTLDRLLNLYHRLKSPMPAPRYLPGRSRIEQLDGTPINEYYTALYSLCKLVVYAEGMPTDSLAMWLDFAEGQFRSLCGCGIDSSPMQDCPGDRFDISGYADVSWKIGSFETLIHFYDIACHLELLSPLKRVGLRPLVLFTGDIGMGQVYVARLLVQRLSRNREMRLDGSLEIISLLDYQSMDLGAVFKKLAEAKNRSFMIHDVPEVPEDSAQSLERSIITTLKKIIANNNGKNLFIVSGPFGLIHALLSDSRLIPDANTWLYNFHVYSPPQANRLFQQFADLAEIDVAAGVKEVVEEKYASAMRQSEVPQDMDRHIEQLFHASVANMSRRLAASCTSQEANTPVWEFAELTPEDVEPVRLIQAP